MFYILTYNSTMIEDHSIDSDNEINFQELFRIFLQSKWLIVSVTSFVSLFGVIYSLYLPNIYESKVVLAPVNASSSIAGNLQRFSGLAGFAGINLPPRYDESNSSKAIKKISTLSFFENNILKNINLPELMAVQSWDSLNNVLIFDESTYEVSSDTWVREVSYPKQQIPSAQESFKVFKSKHLTLIEDNLTGFITLSIKHQSPFIAKQWATLIVDEINSFYREKDKLESQKAVSYLNEQIAMTGLSEIKQVLAQLMQEEIQKLTLIEANNFYVFDYIDTPAVMEEKVEPVRSLICILFALIGLIVSILITLIRHRIANNGSHEL